MQGERGVEKRKSRCIMTTNTEWQRIAGRARKAGLPISRYAVQRLLELAGETTVLPGLLRQTARDLRVLVRIEERRFREENAGTEWDELIGGVEAELDGEEAMG